MSAAPHGVRLVLCPQVPLFVTPWTVARQAPLSMGFFRQEYWSGLLCPSSGNLPDSGIEPGFPAFRQILYHLSHQGNPYNRICAKSLQSCPTLCNPMDCSLPGSSVHGILQARILEWVAVSSSRGSSQPRDRTRFFLKH